MRRYSVPRVAFINKLDRSGANPYRVTEQLREKLSHNAVMMQIPIGLEDKHSGLVDLLTMKAYTFQGPNGEEIKEIPIPDDLLATAKERRTILLDALSTHSDELTELMIEEKEIPLKMLKDVIRKVTVEMKMTPVFMGSAFKNKGVQLLLDGVTDFLPSPYDVKNYALDITTKSEEKIEMYSDATKPFVGYAFKLEEGRFGQLTYLRVYQGRVDKGKPIYNMSTKKKHNVGRLVRMHANEMGEIQSAEAGDIVALFGIDCATGTTFTDGTLEVNMTSMHVPERRYRPGYRSQEPRSSGQPFEGAQPLHEGRPDVPREAGRGIGTDHHLGHGRVASRRVHRAHAPRIRRGTHDRPPPGGLSRNHHPARRFQLLA